jgi:hypothetical protein
MPKSGETENSKHDEDNVYDEPHGALGTGSSSITASVEVKKPAAPIEKKGPKFMNLEMTLAKKAHEEAVERKKN